MGYYYNYYYVSSAKYQRSTQREGGHLLGLVELEICKLLMMASKGTWVVGTTSEGQAVWFDLTCLPEELAKLYQISRLGLDPGMGRVSPVTSNNS